MKLRRLSFRLLAFAATCSVNAAEADAAAETGAGVARKADAALRVQPPSVTQKTRLAPSGNPHDYAGTAPYFRPDPAKPGGRPYLRHDGKINPESRTARPTSSARRP